MKHGSTKGTALLRVVLMVTSIATATFAMEHVANATTGWVTGTWSFWNKNGNYCPSTNACVGARYTQSQFNTALPVSNAYVLVLDSGGTLIGQGYTNDNGTYTISWTRSTFPTQIQLGIATLHARFILANTAGQLISNGTPLINTAGSTSQANPQNIGGWQVGTSASPDPYYNAYWGAEHEWRDVLQYVGTAVNNWTGIEVRGFADNMPGFLPGEPAPTSGASGPTKRVQLDANAGFSPQARVMHELGHIATYVANPWQIAGALNYNWGGNAGWNQTSAEYGDAAFEEAFATHYGSIAFWWDNSTTPTTCLVSQTTCYDGAGNPALGTDIEATSYPYNVNNCSTAPAAPEQRWPLSAMRFFWDVFDNHNDADGDSYSANQGNFWQHLAMLGFYPQGTGANQINEPWNSARTSVSEPDGRGSTSYSYNYVNSAGLQSISILQTDNCYPL